MASREPIPVTRARLFGARSIPTSELTFKAKVTSSGAISTRVVPMIGQRVQRDETPSDPVDCWGVPLGEGMVGHCAPYGGMSPERTGARTLV